MTTFFVNKKLPVQKCSFLEIFSDFENWTGNVTLTTSTKNSLTVKVQAVLRQYVQLLKSQ